MKSTSRIALILAGIAAIPLCLSAQTPGGVSNGLPPAPVPAHGQGPKIQFNTENCLAGTNMVGEPIQYTFVVTNTGDEMLVLSNVIPSCGCTTIGALSAGQAVATSGGGSATGPATPWTREIPPGQTGVIPVQVNTSNLTGRSTRPSKSFPTTARAPRWSSRSTALFGSPSKSVPSRQPILPLALTRPT